MKELFHYCSLIIIMFINNSGIPGEESKGDSNPTPLMKQSNKLTIITVSYMISSRIGKH